MHYLFVVFIGAFLLFQVQPLIAKLILPYFGGGAAVWTACMLFFQAFLLAGYGYSHILSRIRSIKLQVILHISLLVISVFTLPIGLSEHVLPKVFVESPLLNILYQLMLSVGLPYFILSSTGPLVQNWYASNHQGKAPYFLYSWSNVASLIALLSFPFVFEPILAASTQLILWSVLYGVYVLAFIVIAITTYRGQLLQPIETTQSITGVNIDTGVAKIDRHTHDFNLTNAISWVALSSLGVIFLVATTNAITQNVAPIPFLWILPLCLYLLSFIICFHSDRWYIRWYWLILLILGSIIAIFLYFIGSQFDLITQVILYSFVLLAACMVCHGELAKTKPAPRYLTHFYLLIALGGFLGSLFVAFIATNVFQQFLEFPLAFISLLLLLSVVYWREKLSIKYVLAMSVSVVVCVSLFTVLLSRYQQNDIFQQRNFYGILTVKDVDVAGKTERRLVDGTTSHGTQYLDESLQQIPLSYYRKGTGGAIAIELMQQTKQTGINVGFVGLGAGALAAYGEKEDSFSFFELNPAVINAAQEYFTFLSNSNANIKVIEGDARISIAKDVQPLANKPFDVLILDAFSGDSIPQHLLTVEAFSMYQQVVSKQGIIAVHISNSHLNLLPLMKGIADHTQMALVYFHTAGKRAESHDTDWVWLTHNNNLIDNPVVKLQSTRVKLSSSEQIVWTDDHSHLMSLLK
ncbi:fused MFS/spermidine synthase [Thalassotalea sp. 1_MG-2023]|uniref:spermidine synthase n=1 Tax=Thalassotalea sp. 1_MG-2023 TaxID=3062680 RepID=UPI0026E415AC|nr:fused MFS/spermidine synthase [Thalassotalea sp. 1_MG-2023]MDO6426682.1 fused MFS/spermidine synthase [Thalassotalea sp. 1_MG-2023]